MTAPSQPSVADQRVLVGTPAVLQVVLTDSAGEPADAVGTVTVGVKAADATVILTAGTATDQGANTGEYTVTLPANDNTQLALLTATWIDSGAGSFVTLVEVVGRFWFSISEALAIETQVNTLGQDTERVRREVEVEAEGILNWSCVPRYARVALDGTDDEKITVPDRFVRAVRSVRVYTDTTTHTTFTDAELAELVKDDQTIQRPLGKAFDPGRGNIVIEYEHGWDRPEEDLKRAGIQRFRYRLSTAKAGVNDRTLSYTDGQGATYRLAQPDEQSTGMPDVDAVYQRYAKQFGGSEGPAFGSFDYDPSRMSVFHGAER